MFAAATIPFFYNEKKIDKLLPTFSKSIRRGVAILI